MGYNGEQADWRWKLDKAGTPIFYTFVKYHFDNVKYFGVSAQGLDYDNRGKMTEEEVCELTDQKRRAFVSSGKNRDYDITLPLSWLLELDVW